MISYHKLMKYVSPPPTLFSSVYYTECKVGRWDSISLDHKAPVMKHMHGTPMSTVIIALWKNFSVAGRVYTAGSQQHLCREASKSLKDYMHWHHELLVCSQSDIFLFHPLTVWDHNLVLMPSRSRPLGSVKGWA